VPFDEEQVTMSDPIPNRLRARPVPHPGRWVGALVVAVLAAMMVNALVTNEKFRWDVFADYVFRLPVIRGVGWTLVLTFGSMALAIVMAVVLAVMRRSDNPVLRYVAWFYIWFFRGTPVYVQLVFWGLITVLYPTLSLGIPFGPEFLTFSLNNVFINGFWPAFLGLAFNEAAYLSEIMRAGLISVDAGQGEAARALGMTESSIFRRVVLPQAMRVIVPPTGNETISMLKTTSLVIAVPFTLDLYYQANAIGNRTFAIIPSLIIACFWYLVVTSILMIGQSYLERYFGRGFGAEKAKRRIRAAGTRGRRRELAIAASQTAPHDPFEDVTP
jgi:polar amino acid transport system permease protein